MGRKVFVDGKIIEGKTVVVMTPTGDKIIDLLKKRKMTPTQIKKKLTVNKATISKELKLLKILGIVDWESDGKKRIYHLGER